MLRWFAEPPTLYMMPTHGSLRTSIPRVFALLQRVPKGHVVTYAVVARFCRIPNPRNVSWVLQKNEDVIAVPCYRVVRSDGSLASGYKFGGRTGQEKRLRADGVLFDDRGRVKAELMWRGGLDV